MDSLTHTQPLQNSLNRAREQKWKGENTDRKGDKSHDSKDGKEQSDKVVCHMCEGQGHTARDCPKQVNTVSELGTPHPPRLPLRQGIVAGKGVEDILLDTGATFSIVASDVIGEHYTTTETVQIKGVGAEPKKYTTTNVTVTVGKHNFTLRVAVADRKGICYSIIVGHNLRSMNLRT